MSFITLNADPQAAEVKMRITTARRGATRIVGLIIGAPRYSGSGVHLPFEAKTPTLALPPRTGRG
jgi:hypothetical protein